MMKIGSFTMGAGAALAPMAGVTDMPMRILCFEQGAAWAVTEMISAKGYLYAPENTRAIEELLRRDPSEGALGLQLFGREPQFMAEAAARLSDKGFAFIDINMGCPAHRIVGNGEGSALMKEVDLAGEIIAATVRASSVPVTVKMRIGWDDENINCVDLAKRCENAGAAALTVHGRTKLQMYSGEVDRETIKKVKQSVHIPVIANGDILCADDAISMLKDTGADGVAIGRGAVGNPFIFSEIICAFLGHKYIPPTLEERVEVALWQLRLAIEDKGERASVPEARKQIASYLHSFGGAAKIRAKINMATTYAEVEAIFREALKREK